MNRVGLFAMAAAAALGLAASQAPASTVWLTASGGVDGQNVQTTISCDFNLGAMGLGNKKNVQLTGGMLFPEHHSTDLNNGAICDPSPNTPTDPGPGDDVFSGPKDNGPPVTDPGSDSGDGGTGDNLPIVTPGATTVQTPLPLSIWGAGALVASLGVIRGIRRRKSV